MGRAVGLLILDKSPGMNTNIRATLEHMPQFHTIDELNLDQVDAENAVALVFLDDIKLANCIARISELRERHPKLGILVAFDALTACDFAALLVAGADAFVGRSQSPREIGAALLGIAEGSSCLAPQRQKSGFDLTPREEEVLRLLISGFSNKDVARHLDLSVRTVETHRINLRYKTRTGRLSDLVLLARQIGLVPIEVGKNHHEHFRRAGREELAW
nr:response regulator transcription factor [Methylobacterium sp. GXF4]